MVIAELTKDFWDAPAGTRVEVLRSVKYMSITPALECQRLDDQPINGKSRELIAPEFLALTA